MTLRLPAAAVMLALGLVAPAAAEAPKPLRVALVEDSTGPLEVYARQLITGFRLGLEYASGGTGVIAGRRMDVIVKDSQGKPDLARSLLEQAYGDEDAELAVGGTSSAVALAMLPVAQEWRRLLIVDGAVADSITGERWNRYIFRVDRNSSQDAMAQAKSLGRPGTVIAILTQDYAYGHDGAAAFTAALEPTGARVVHEEYVPTTTTDFTAPMQRILAALRREEGRKVLFVMWAGSDPMTKLAAMNPGREGVALATGGNLLPVLTAWKGVPALDGMEGATYYYYEMPKNPVNDWLIAEHARRTGGPPDYFVANGMVTALGLAAALNRTHGASDSETLIAALEGLAFDSPKGRVQFRKQDHQALQSMFGFRLSMPADRPWAVPVLTREYGIGDLDVPVQNGR